jgi:hypothetical protein
VVRASSALYRQGLHGDSQLVAASNKVPLLNPNITQRDRRDARGDGPVRGVDAAAALTKLHPFFDNAKTPYRRLRFGVSVSEKKISGYFEEFVSDSAGAAHSSQIGVFCA